MAANTNTTQPFRFMDLPGEIRNHVYALLLCSFAPPPVPYNIEMRINIMAGREQLQYARAFHHNDTSIMLVNSQVHREAYDVMVKTNRFVRINCLLSKPWATLLMAEQIPIIAIGQSMVNFRSYVLDITISADQQQEADGSPSEPFSIMALARDLGTFCNATALFQDTCPELCKSATMEIHMAPILGQHPCPRYKPDMTQFFTGSIPEALVKPLRCFWGFKTVEVRGPMPAELTANIKHEMTSNNYEDPNHIMRCLVDQKERGSECYKKADLLHAHIQWTKGLQTIHRIRHSRSWDSLVQRGGDTFINNLAEIHCKMGLNVAQVAITLEGRSVAHATKGIMRKELYRELTKYGLGEVMMSKAMDAWRDGHTWLPSDTLMAKLLYRLAMSTRLWEGIERAPRAGLFIEQAPVLVPNDPVLLRERQKIIAWSQGM